MSRLTRDGTAEPVSRDQILRHARGQGNVHFPCSADHEQDWQPYPVDPYSAICDDHTYIHTYIHTVLIMTYYVTQVVIALVTHISRERETPRLGHGPTPYSISVSTLDTSSSCVRGRNALQHQACYSQKSDIIFERLQTWIAQDVHETLIGGAASA